MHDVLTLDVLECIDQLMTQLLHMLACDAALANELGKAVAVYVVGDYATSYARNILKIIYHDDIGMCQTIAHVELLLYHCLISRVIGILRPQCLNHHPLAELLGSIDMIEFLIPFGKMLYFGPAGCLIGHCMSLFVIVKVDRNLAVD